MTFMSPTAASQFIDSICSVCPCKANPPPPPSRNIAPSLALAQSFVPDGRTMQNIAVQNRDSSATYAAAPRTLVIPPTSRNPPPSAPDYTLSSSPMHPPIISHSALNIDSSSRPPSSPVVILPSNSAVPQSFQLNTNSAPAPPTLPPSVAGKPTHAIHSSSSNNSSLPESSPPTSSLNSISNNANLMPPPRLPSAALSASVHPTDLFMASLREIPILYDLPRRELENLVAEVVREEGFPKLVRFSTKTFYATHS
jgi:hypothetical protein